MVTHALSKREHAPNGNYNKDIPAGGLFSEEHLGGPLSEAISVSWS